MKVEWEVFKDFVDQRSLSIQWLDLENQYWLKAFDGNFSLECFLDKPLAENFETNYKSLGNKSPKLKVLSEPADISMTMFNATSVVEISAGAEVNIDFLLEQQGEELIQIVYGGTLYTENSSFADYVRFQVIDLDNVLGYGAGTVLKEYIKKAYLNQNGNFSEYDDAGAEIPVGIYLRCIYKSEKETGTTKVKINYLLGLKN